MIASALIKIIPLGGLGEIGLNCMLFESQDDIVVIDCGVMFSDLQMLGVEFVIPDMSYLRAHKNKIKAYVITHAHEDHIGALPYALKSHPAPVYCTEFARKLIEAKCIEVGVKDVEFRPLVLKKKIKLGDFSITPYAVTHSIIESLAIFLDTPIGKIIFTGDFKIDPNPYYGQPMDLTPFRQAGDSGVLLLMSDSTNVEREGHSISEDTIYHKFEEIFSAAEGLTIVSMFASNVARIGQAMEIAAKLGKKVAVIGRNLEQNVRIAHELGYLKNMHEVLISIDDLHKWPRKRCIVLSTGSQGEYRSALVRISNDEHRNVKLTEGDQVVISSKFIPGNEKAIGRMVNSLFKLGANVFYEAVSDIHVSGHANAEELQKMIEVTRPKFFVPVHGEYRHLVKHARLARSLGILRDNTLIAVNGDILELTHDHLIFKDKLEENRVFIEGEGGKDVSKVTIRDRRKVAETGIVFSVLIRNSVTGAIMGGPDIISRGLVEDGMEGNLFENAKDVVHAILRDAEPELGQRTPDLQEEIRIGLRRYFQTRLGKRPVVLPIVVDV